MSYRIASRALVFLFVLTLAVSFGSVRSKAAQPDSRPNILFAITDDQSGRHAGAYGDLGVKTPAFDRVAREGVLFECAYCAAPSCTPSRSAILTGQAIYRLEQGGQLFGALSAKFPVFPQLLKEAGYFVGHTGKTWSPGNLQAGGWKEHPAGIAFQKRKAKPPYRGMSGNDYAANFGDFLAERPSRKPFCFWYGTSEPHRSYEPGAGLKAGKTLADAHLPGCLPDRPEYRSDVLDYYLEVEHFDKHLARIIKQLEDAGELDNTLIIATSDHGMPFPRGKATLYELGTHVPLAIRWPKKIPAGRSIDDFVSLTEIAPTILDAVGLDVPDEMNGRSLMGILSSKRSGRLDESRDFVVTAFERHTWCRPDGVGYPMRAIRTHSYAYIRNYAPDRWPMGDPDFESPHQGSYGDIDNGASKTLMLVQQKDPVVAPLFQLAFGKRPAEELYDMQADPDQLRNLAEEPSHASIKQQLAERLAAYLKETGDPRAEGKTPWDQYPYYFGDFAKRAK